jgi:MOSC domain-containing protein YiiM
MPDEASIDSVQVGMPQTVSFGNFSEPDATDHRLWKTGFVKRLVKGPIWCSWNNLAGDGQADLIHHGGSHKAVCVYPASHYPWWQTQLSLPNFSGGSFGENFTVAGLDESGVCIGDTWRVGEALVQVSQPRQPCWKLARRWNIRDLANQVRQNGRTGWYFRVLAEGHVAAGMTLTLENRPHAKWSVAAANQIMHHDKTNYSAATELAALAELSPSWQATLRNRIQRNAEPDAKLRLGGRG